MGVVYHAIYLRWFEAGRANFMRNRGCPYSSIERDGIQLPVVEAGLTYLKPARYAAIGRSGRIARLPDEVRTALLASEQETGG